MRLFFEPYISARSGLLAELLESSYASLLEALPRREADLLRTEWFEQDAAVHAHPDTVGSCGFLLLAAGNPVGFIAFDPRRCPLAELGHVCVIPSHQGRGRARAAVEHVASHLSARGFSAIEVRTGSHAFFAPARALYERCGFRERSREAGTLSVSPDTVVYHLELERGAA